MTNEQESQDKPKVLAIDDERMNLNTLHALLRDECKVMVATSGEQGLEIARQSAPDLILLDVKMPGISGHEVCRELKADRLTAGIPVVFISALTDPEDETLGFELGAADYIAKPFNAAVVRARVRTQLRVKQQADLIASYAFLDGLTGLFNRRSLDQRLDEEWRRGLRSGKPLAVAMIDVDHFKLYNDRYGHGPGDDCLKAVGAALRGSVKRPGDLVARYGGEEFCLMLPESDLDAARVVAEQARLAVSALALPHAASLTAPHVTISVGVATAVPQVDSSVEALLKQADTSLYRAKQAGRNRVGVD